MDGAWADGSGWQGVYSILKDTYSVRIVQNPTLSLEGDVAATKMILSQQSEPVILVGHSYGGVVITEAGNSAQVGAGIENSNISTLRVTNSTFSQNSVSSSDIGAFEVQP